ncbi:MAG: hypothetical protein ACODAU_02735 [Myxococcota bacterium]
MMRASSLLRGGPTWISLVLLMGAGACGDGTDRTWREAFDASEAGWLLNVGGPAEGPLWAVGGTPTDGVVLEESDEGWAPRALGVEVPLLNWTHAFGPDDRFVVGNGGTVLRYDGDGFERMATPTTEDLWGVWGAAPDDVWAVGGSGRTGSVATVLHFDGASWETEVLPPLQRTGVRAFFKVWGTAANDVWVVGQAGAVVHWDGSQWTEHLVGVSDDLISLWGTGPDRVAVVGGRSNGVVAVWDGEGWSSESVAPLPGLNGVWMRRDGVAHVAGIDGTLATVDPGTFAWEEADAGTRTTFHSVFGRDGRLWAVGGNLESGSGPYQGVAFVRSLGSEE